MKTEVEKEISLNPITPKPCKRCGELENAVEVNNRIISGMDEEIRQHEADYLKLAKLYGTLLVRYETSCRIITEREYELGKRILESAKHYCTLVWGVALSDYEYQSFDDGRNFLESHIDKYFARKGGES